MKNVPAIFIVLIAFSGCRFYNDFPREYRSTNELSHEIKLEVHLAGLKNRVSNADTFFVSKIMVTQEVIPSNHYDTNQVLDIEPERFFEMVDVIQSSFDKNSGSYCRKITLLEYEEGSSMSLKLLTAFTMGVPCLVGMPANWTSTRVKIQHECFDDSEDLISSTRAVGYNKTFVAMYWGFGADARKRSTQLAMKEALINSQQ